MRNTPALPCWKTPENQSTLRKKHLQCPAKGSGKQPDGSSRKQQGSLSGLGLTLCSLVAGRGRAGVGCDRGGGAARAVTARDAHGCAWRRGKTCQHCLQEGPAPPQHLQPSRSALNSPAHHSSQLWGAGHGEQGLRSRIAWAVGRQHSQAGIEFPLGSVLLCSNSASIYVDLPLSRPQRGVWAQIPPLPGSGAEEAADTSMG